MVSLSPNLLALQLQFCLAEIYNYSLAVLSLVTAAHVCTPRCVQCIEVCVCRRYSRSREFRPYSNLDGLLFSFRTGFVLNCNFNCKIDPYIAGDMH